MDRDKDTDKWYWIFALAALRASSIDPSGREGKENDENRCPCRVILDRTRKREEYLSYKEISLDDLVVSRTRISRIA